MKTLLGCFSVFLIFGCSSQKDQAASSNLDSISGNERVPMQMEVTRVPTLPEKIDFTNTPNLVIRLSENKYHIYYHRDSLATSNVNEIDNFIQDRIDSLRKEDLLFIGEADSSKKRFRDLKPVLMKHGIFKFKIKTQDEVY